jgi:4-aminobutyrate aminotransferase-like enzyme
MICSAVWRFLPIDPLLDSTRSKIRRYMPDRSQGGRSIPAGPNVVRLAPALIVTREQIDRGIEVLRDALT